MTELTVKLLSVPEIIDLWNDYSNAVGKDALHASYGSRWPRLPFEGELVYEFRVPTCGGLSERVGWASLYYDAMAQITWHSHGIYPEFQRQKLTKPLTQISKGLGFSETPCVALGATILDTNATYQAWMREHHAEKGWKAAGRVTLPEGYDLYVILREDWNQ